MPCRNGDSHILVPVSTENSLGASLAVSDWDDSVDFFLFFDGGLLNTSGSKSARVRSC